MPKRKGWEDIISRDYLANISTPMQTQNPNCLVMVDNCYAEFVDIIEPTMVVRYEPNRPFQLVVINLEDENILSLVIGRVQTWLQEA